MIVKVKIIKEDCYQKNSDAVFTASRNAALTEFALIASLRECPYLIDYGIDNLDRSAVRPIFVRDNL